MDRKELLSYKEKLGYDLGQLEIDYYHHKILNILFSKYNTLYFKGGTGLQKCYNLKRFSEDLDFNYENIDIEKLLNYLDEKIDENIQISQKYDTPFDTSVNIRIEGILFNGKEESKCKISLDFRKGDIYLEPKKIIIRPPYHDLPNYLILALEKEEILAEKIRAIISRNKARDIYDLTELLYQGVNIDYDLINKKLKTYDIEFNTNSFLKKVYEKNKIYNNEIKRLTPIYPSFEECYSTISSKF